MRSVRGRLAEHESLTGARVIDDSYNANPHSLAAAMQVLADAPAPRWLALGDMAELGDDAVDLHREAGVAARRMGIDRLLSVGSLARHAASAFGDGACHFDDRESLTQALCEELKPGVTVLIKGSRSMEMDVVVRTLLHGETECC